MLPKSCSLSACHQLKDLHLQPVSGVCLRKNKQTSVIEIPTITFKSCLIAEGKLGDIM